MTWCDVACRVNTAGRCHPMWYQRLSISPGLYWPVSDRLSATAVLSRCRPPVDNPLSHPHCFRIRHRRHRFRPDAHFRSSGRGHVTWSERRQRRAAIGWRRRLRSVTSNRQSRDRLSMLPCVVRRLYCLDFRQTCPLNKVTVAKFSTNRRKTEDS